MDYSSWLKDETAAEIIGCSTKTLCKMAKQGRIETGKFQNPDTGAWQTRYNPDDAQRLRLERNPKAEPFILPPNGQKTALQRAEPATVEILTRALIERMAPAQASKNRSLTELRHKLYLTAEEAVLYTGLGIEFLRNYAKANPQHLKRFPRRGPLQSEVFRRRDLEDL